MKQKPLQRLLSHVVIRRLWSEAMVVENSRDAIWCGERSRGLRNGTGLGLLRLGWAGSGIVEGIFGFGCGRSSGLRELNAWDMRPWRGYAAPPVAAGKSKGAEEGSKVDRRVNRAIVARMVRLVGEEGHEVLSRFEALNRAQQAGLDLVEVDGKGDPPVCKLMDFSKERFKVKRQEKELRKKQLERRRLDDLKEVRFSSRTEQKDLELKADMVSRLLGRGHRVKLSVQFHGNDKGDWVGVELLERALGLLQADMKVENGPRIEKMRAWVMIRPVQEQKTKKKGLKSAPEAVDFADEDSGMENDKVVEG